MTLPSPRALRYTRAWLRSPVAAVDVETSLDRDGLTVPASVLRPEHAKGPLPGWVVLHGMTRPGRAHGQLQKFARALVSSGAVVILPEVPEWRALSLSPHVAGPTVRAALRGLRDTGWAQDRPAGLIGFSFGAPHAIASAADPRIREQIAGVAGFGGYCDIEATFRFMMTGDAGGGLPFVFPDPYARWIVAANYLAKVPGLADHRDVAAALHTLAAFSGDGDFEIPSWDARYTPKIAELRDAIAPERRAVFDLFAAPEGALPARAAAFEMGDRLAVAARATDPLIDPTEGLGCVTRPVHVLHGRTDNLISCAEAPKIAAALQPGVARSVTITRLFGHSGQGHFPLLRALQEVPRFLRALTRMLDVA